MYRKRKGYRRKSLHATLSSSPEADAQRAELEQAIKSHTARASPPVVSRGRSESVGEVPVSPRLQRHLLTGPPQPKPILLVSTLDSVAEEERRRSRSARADLELPKCLITSIFTICKNSINS